MFKMDIQDVYNIKNFEDRSEKLHSISHWLLSIKKWFQNILLSLLLSILWAFSSFAGNSLISPVQKDLSQPSTGLENSKRRFWNTQEDGSFLTLERLKEEIPKYNKTAPEGEKILTVLSYNKYRHKIPGVPSNPDKFYTKGEWKKIGKWRGLFGSTFIQTISELQKEIIEYNKTAPEGKKILTLSSYNKYRHNIPGAPSNPHKFYKKEEWKKQGKWRGLLGQYFIPTILELKKTITEYNKTAPKSRKIVTVLSYKKYRHKIPGAHSNPNKFYTKEEWKKIGKWRGLFGPKFIQIISELQKEVIEYNQTVPEGEKILTSSSYNKYRHKIPGVPSNPNKFYKEEWERQGKWRGFFAGVKRCELEFNTQR